MWRLDMSPIPKFSEDRLDLDDKGYIILKDHTLTSVDGVFAAGDVHDYRYRQAITAGGFGCMAALDIEKWLTEKKHLARMNLLTEKKS